LAVVAVAVAPDIFTNKFDVPKFSMDKARLFALAALSVTLEADAVTLVCVAVFEDWPMLMIGSIAKV
jgi:hypothetical protein